MNYISNMGQIMTIQELGFEIKSLRKSKQWSQGDLENYSG